MLRELIAWVLNNYLGKYVGNLNTAQLTVALLTGEVELENLPLRRDALRNLGLPLQALSGTVGKIKLQIPVRSFRTAPWCINVENVYVVVGPVNLDDWDAEVEEQADLDYKLARLDGLEANWRASREAALEGGYYASSYSGWLSYGTSLVTNICENLELKIRNVHVRYEDDSLSVPGQRFSCGVTIESLSARSCDERWQTGFKTAWNQGGASFKLVELDGMSLYWDGLRAAEQCGDVASGDLAEVMSRNLAGAQHRYLVSPVSAQAHLKRDRSETPLRTRSRPRLVCELVLNEVQLTLNDWQYDQMVACVRGLDDIAKYRRFRLLRPQNSVQHDARAWWLYAAQCHGYRRISAQRRLEIARDNRKYLSIYAKIIANPNETLTPDLKEHKDRVEKERTFDELRSLREIAMGQIPTPEGATAEANQGRSMLVQWFPQWWGWYNTAPPSSSASTADAAATSPTNATPPHSPLPSNASIDPTKDQLEDELLNALAGSVENNSLLKRDAVFGKFTFTLNRGTLDVCSGTQLDVAATLMLKLQFENLILNIESRPRSASHYVGLSLGSVFVKDHITNNADFPDLIRPQLKDEPLLTHSRLQRNATTVQQRLNASANGATAAEPLFQLNYERRPLSHNTDYRLHIKSQSLDIVYNVEAIKWIVDFVMRPHQVQSTRRRLQAMKHKTKMEFIKNWENMLDGDQLGTGRQTWALEIDISAPQIIFAENFLQRNGAIVVCDFGRLQLTNGFTAPTTSATGGDAAQAQQQQQQQAAADAQLMLARRDSEDEEAFMTPCSTPPGSEVSTSPTLCTALSEMTADFVLNTGDTALNERALHDKLYDTYSLNLTDMQVLVCKQRERWSFASAKGSSPLHVLDRFSISLQVERRVVLTHDPQFPSLTVSGSLPKLVAHVNEHKVAALLLVLNTLSGSALQSPQKQSPGSTQPMAEEGPMDATMTTTEAEAAEAAATSARASDEANEVHRELSKVIMLQFVIDQMALEVQSRGRSIVELQVTGVKAGYTQRTEDTSLTLSVHGLLLVDAIQSFGPDFELLIASHRHVGMDSVSGSLKQSEPCSPNSPGSPDPMYDRRPTSPLTISKAISSLQRTNSADWSTAVADVDALITVEVLFVAPDRETGEQLHIANIQFNNLDIIANQETIVELLGFARRVFPKRKLSSIASVAPTAPTDTTDGVTVADADDPFATLTAAAAPNIRTEITFDFHRLNVLVLRALMRDQFLLGRKVGTFTMSEARIHATLGQAAVTVEGSLGGLQVLDLTPEGIAHQRILSVGKDPLTEPPHIEPDLLSALTQEIYAMGHAKDGATVLEERQALSFRVSRTANACVDIRIRMASVWYTHCARFMQELSWCATEFKHYLKNLARSIRDKAADMALNLVQLQRTELAANVSILQTPKAAESTSPRRRQRMTSICGTAKAGSASIDIRLDIVLDTPVLVMPRSSCSPHVFVAHLGKITVTNVRSAEPQDVATGGQTPKTPVNPTVEAERSIFTIDEECCGSVFSIDDVSTPTNDESDKIYVNHDFLRAFDDEADGDADLETYTIDVRNMNLFSLDTSTRKGFRISALPRAEEFYSCAADAVPILHDTAIRLQIVRRHETTNANPCALDQQPDEQDILDITGSVVKPLNLSLSRRQYEQLIETLENLFKVPADLVRPPTEAKTDGPFSHGPETSASAAKSDPIDRPFHLEDKFKRRLFTAPSADDADDAPKRSARKSFTQPRVLFELPTFIVQLQSEQNTPLVGISFRDFEVHYVRTTFYETSVRVSLRSLLMEDLLQPADSKHRAMVVSSSPPVDGAPGTRSAMRSSSAFGSRSCPNLVGIHLGSADGVSGSLPENLETTHGFAATLAANRTMCPETPPPSPQARHGSSEANVGGTSQQQQDNLVLYTALLVDPTCPQFAVQYGSMRQRSNIDFNSLDLVVSVQSWFALLNFFGLMSDDEEAAGRGTEEVPAVPEDENEAQRQGNTKLDISVRSLTLVFTRPDYELARANVSNAHFIVSRDGVRKSVEGRLGSISLIDLTSHGALYRERFLTTGNEALNFAYRQDIVRQSSRTLASDAQLRIQMSSVRYVHTKRFVSEIQAFFKEFQLVQMPVMRKMKPSESRTALKQRPLQLGLDIKAGSPIILLPMSARSDQVIVADLGEFSLKNSFHLASAGHIISVMRDPAGPHEILDVMHVHLVNTDLFAGVRHSAHDLDALGASTMDMGSYAIQIQGTNLLNTKCHLKLVVERNMDAWSTQNVPDFSVHGTLSRLEAVLDLQQYELIRGFLAYNLGEPLDDLLLPEPAYLTDSVASFLNEDVPVSAAAQQSAAVWTNTSITLDLQDVSVRLQIAAGDQTQTAALACINFIKSSLKIDQFSDGSQDIDLVSQEILVTDSRFVGAQQQPVTNCHSNILQPIRSGQHSASVQAEVHSRRRRDASKYTILLNNMRMMAILDWLESVRDFLSQSAELPADQVCAVAAATSSTAAASTGASTAGATEESLEVVLNITDSELVFVERPDRADTNAVILKSTTIVSYRPADVSDKVMSINLNHLEVFSCILGREEETALSIIDPVTVNLDLRRNTLDIQLQKRLCVRLSYHDLKMFIQMLESVPKQTRKAKTKELQGVDGRLAADWTAQVDKLKSLGFRTPDCERALRLCNDRVDDAALWLTQNAEPSRSLTAHSAAIAAAAPNPLAINAFCLRANFISVCVIDDCRDADVPLLEMSLAQLDITPESSATGTPASQAGASGGGGLFKAGTLRGTFASDYYNRALSGWEPLVEPWKCEATWSYSLGSGMQRNRLNLRVGSQDLLKLNVTTTIVELAQLVHNNWTQDYYAATVGGPQTYRPRIPFVPFAIRNQTGVRLWFTTIVSETGSNSPQSNAKRSTELLNQPDTRWSPVEPGATQTFSFGPPSKQRHLDSHKSNFHQVAVRVEGWSEVGPVSVDRVGVFFRHARHENDEYLLMPRTRIVFAVTLEGSAHKLVTVRSALQLHNRLSSQMLLKMEHFYGHLNVRVWPAAITAVVQSLETYNVPLTHVHSFLFLRPLPAADAQAVQAVVEAVRAVTATTSTTTTDSVDAAAVPAVQRFNGNDYWNQFESGGGSGASSRSGSASAAAHSFANSFQFCTKSVHWKDMEDGEDVHQALRTCKGNADRTFRWVAAIRRDGYPAKDASGIPGHSITLCAPLSLHNLLPCDLLYRLSSGTQGRISPTESAAVHDVDLEAHIEITLTLDGYPKPAPIQVPACLIGAVETNLRLVDVKGRMLILRITVVVVKGAGMQMSVSAPFWLVNRTGLPLVFRQEGVAHESAGQFTENEQARLVSPLMYSISDPEASPAMTMRLGKRFGGSPPWCQPFSMHKDIINRQLRSEVTNETFIIGIEVRRGRGRYSKTSVLTFSPRFQLYNRSSYKLQFSQKCFASTVIDSSAKAMFIEAVPGCNLPFHWPRLDRLQELCIRLPEVEGCMWSGGIPIHETQSLYINIRNTNGDMHFLRVEIVLQGATYFLLFGDAQALPPPIRIDNYSDVPMKFHQYDCRHQWRTVVRPHTSIAYALDEPFGSAAICVEAPGGVSHNYSLCDLGMSHNLTYENFIYIAFSGTFRNGTPLLSNGGAATASAVSARETYDYDLESQQLVLTVSGDGGRVCLARKQPGDRAQLWRMNKDKQLEHEGSSPPTEPGSRPSASVARLVLDLERAPQPMKEIALVVRASNQQRRSTQTWRFTPEGRLMCEHSNMCVQTRGGFFGLCEGSEAVLGMIVSDTHAITERLVPLEQAIERQKLRPGSGFLSVAVSMDGPIKTIQIKDIKSLTTSVLLTLDPTWHHVSHLLPHMSEMPTPAQRNHNNNNKNSAEELTTTPPPNSLGEYHINVRLSRGVGLSLIAKRPREELCFISLENIALEAVATPIVRSLDLSVGDLQIDNQLFETPCPVMLYTIRNSGSSSSNLVDGHTSNAIAHTSTSTLGDLSAVQLNVRLLPSPNTNAVIVEHLILSMRPLAVYLEERLILRLALFFGLGGQQLRDPAALPDESDYEAQRVATKILAANAKRYYFGDLQIVPSQIRLSVITASKLSAHLSEVKRSLGLTLIKFEDASIDFEKFTDRHHFETLEVYWRAITAHYKQELKWQAASILGSVDFLGNPSGLANDLQEGMSGLIFEGSVKSLVKNVTHGLSNSTAKLTESISGGLGRVVLDAQDTETRQRILEMSSGTNSTGEHLKAGLKGFGFGLLGGVTSIVKHTYVGAQTDGIQGFISGLGRGIVGTVTKPVIGVLDLASETANAVRETSKSSHRTLPERKRIPRCLSGAPNGLLPQYSQVQSKGQQHLFLINKRDFSEQFMAYEPCLLERRESKLRLLVSSENVWVFSRSEESTTIIFSYHLSELISCHPVTVNMAAEGHKTKKLQHYIELCLSLPPKSVNYSGTEVVKRPRVRCQTEEMSQRASRHINYAKSVYDEREHTLNSESVMDS